MIIDEKTEKRVVQIRKELELRDTEDLLEIWINNNRGEWTNEAFIAIQRILLDRLNELPLQKIKHPNFGGLDNDQNIERALQSLERVSDLFNHGKLKQALRACQEIIQIEPRLARAYNLQGQIYDEMDQLEEAIASYQEAVRLEPDFKDAQENLKAARNEQILIRQIPQAMKYLEQAKAFAEEDELDRALFECKLAIQASPNYAAAHNYRGILFEELGQIHAAIDAYSEAVQIDPEFYPAQENLFNVRIMWQQEQYHLIAHGEFEVIEEENVAQSPDEIGELSDQGLHEMEMQDFKGNELSIPAFYLDEKAFMLQGWPGYRTRPGRSGYDYVDTCAEVGHVAGVFLRHLFTGRTITHNRFYLIVMLFMGIICLLPLTILLPASLIFGMWSIVFIKLNTLIALFLIMLLFSPYFALGIALFINVWTSLHNRNPVDADLLTGTEE